MVNIGSYGMKNAESCIYGSPKEIELGTLFLLSILNLRMQRQRQISIRMVQVNSTISHRAGFRHVQEVQLHRAPTKRGAPTNEGPRAKADSDKGFSSQKGFNVFYAGPLE
jgi:hypothetical protein